MTIALAAALAAVLFAAPTAAHEGEEHPAEAPQAAGAVAAPLPEAGTVPGLPRLMLPEMDPARGRKLFASKGCVACHAINGVGGHDAAALDAHTMDGVMNPFDFAAKMWAMAPYMIAAQEEALGEQILLTGQELADIIAFVHDDAAQHAFSEADIPPEITPLLHHTHGAQGGGAAAHGEEIGHRHGGAAGHHGAEEGGRQ